MTGLRQNTAQRLTFAFALSKYVTRTELGLSRGQATVNATTTETVRTESCLHSWGIAGSK